MHNHTSTSSLVLYHQIVSASQSHRMIRRICPRMLAEFMEEMELIIIKYLKCTCFICRMCDTQFIARVQYILVVQFQFLNHIFEEFVNNACETRELRGGFYRFYFVILSIHQPAPIINAICGLRRAAQHQT
jgi:hypothetical protein